MYKVSLSPAKELDAVHMSVEVTTSTLEFAGSTPFTGSNSQPQASMVAFNSAVLAAVWAFWQIPRKLLLGQLITRSETDFGLFPSRKRSISFLPSQLQVGEELLPQSFPNVQASTKILSILTQS